MTKLETLDHTVLKMTAWEGNIGKQFYRYKPPKACINIDNKNNIE